MGPSFGRNWLLAALSAIRRPRRGRLRCADTENSSKASECLWRIFIRLFDARFYDAGFRVFFFFYLSALLKGEVEAEIYNIILEVIFLDI